MIRGTEKKIRSLINLLGRDKRDREILRTILKLGGRARYSELHGRLVSKHMAKLTLERRLRSLRRMGLLVREPGEHEGKPTFFHKLGPRLSPDLFDQVDRQMYNLTRHAFLDLEFKAKTDEQRRAVIERVAEDLLTLQRSFTLKTTADCLAEPDKRDIIPGFLWLIDNIPTQAASHLFAFCLLYPEIAKPVIERLTKEAEEAVVRILKMKTESEKVPSKGRR